MVFSYSTVFAGFLYLRAMAAITCCAYEYIYIYDIALFAVMAAIAFSCFAGWPVFDARTAHFSSVPTRSPCPAVF